MYTILFILVLLSGTTAIVLKHDKFGKSPAGERLERIRKSANYENGSFQNQSKTPVMAEDVSYFAVMKDGLFNRSKRNAPKDILPSKKVNLLTLDPETDVLVWFGHSSYLMQIDGKKILVDPVMSGHASPFSFMVKSFNGSDVYSPEDLPEIDYLFITHDHWDHLDYKTVLKLKPKVGKVITSLGTGAHLESWGFSPEQIIEKDWNESAVLDSGFQVTATPARHFSGRGLRRNQAMWASFVLQTPTKKIFIGGDSGYDTHFAKIGAEHGPFDLALLECGQYNKAWKYIHLMPEETVQAAIELKAKTLMPVHWGKFALAYHAWDEPITRITKEAHRLNVPILHPMIGELVDLNDSGVQAEWWKGIN
ncbi:MAG TPA: MBL fold metallo-hydrolase [Prolixibacteraceae bacterium]|nr:MBL fold metallo-hydrolase [Prolixibacteraceae bacterium]